jgi:predicted ATPase
MITRIQIKNFKSLENVDLSLGGLNLFVGTNSSGKSNFLDALRVLQGIGNGFTVSEILNGKPRTSTSEVWDGIRGGAEFATFRKVGEEAGTQRLMSFEVFGRARPTDPFNFEYHISLSAKTGRVMSEWLTAAGTDIFDSTKYENSFDAPTLSVAYSKGNRGKPPKAHFERSRPILHQFADFQQARASDRRLAAACFTALADVQRLDPSPEVLREYSAAQRATRMGEHGENFAALVSSIISDEGNKTAYLEWLRELSPADVDDVLVLEGALKEPLFAVKEGGKTFPAQVLSDGTLRFAAIAAAFFQDSIPAVLTLEEIEKGIHPNRLRLLVELLRSQTMRLGNQVIATTHSPDVLGWLNEKDLNSTFVTTRQNPDGSSMIRAVGDLDAVKRVLKLDGNLPELFSEGWLESVA